MSEKAENPSPAGARESLPQPVKFITEKDNAFRTHHVDGAWGMVNNFGNIQLNFFLERPPMASSVVYQLDEKGTLTDQGQINVKEEDGKHFIVVREYTSAIILSINTARNIRAVLDSFIKIAENLNKT